MLEIRIDIDKKCKRCKKPGATKSGICLACINKGIKKGEFDHIIKPLKDIVKAVVAVTKKQAQKGGDK